MFVRHGIAIGAAKSGTTPTQPLSAGPVGHAAGAIGANGSLVGNAPAASFGSDTRSARLLAAYQALTGPHDNGTNGYFDPPGDLAAGSPGNVARVARLAANHPNDSRGHAGDASPRADAAGRPASATIAAGTRFSATPPSYAATSSLPAATFEKTPAQWLTYAARPANGQLSTTVPGTAALDERPLSGPPDLAQNAAAAAPSASGATAALTNVLYLQEAGTPAPISVYDINQGYIGDCFLLSSIGEIALWHPSAFMNMIQANADGTETVTLHLAANGSLPTYGTTEFKTVVVTVNNTFPSNCVNNGTTQDVLNGQKEIWVQVLEKAVATLGGGYNSIANGGNPMIAMEELTGQPTTWMSPAALTAQQLQNYASAGDLIVMDTAGSGNLPYGLVNNHAYMFDGLTMVGGTAMVQLLNPWGFDEPSAIPLSQLSQGIVEVDIGQFVNSQNFAGTVGSDVITLTYALTNGSIDLGAGNDVLTLANGTNSATVANTETTIGGTGNDTITLGAAASNASIDLGAGSDTLIMGSFVHAATVANAETITGGTGNDTIALGTALSTGMSIDLGAGINKLTLANVANCGSASNSKTLIGGTGNDTVTLGTAVVGGSVDLGGGNDSLSLASGSNAATVANAETVIGGASSDAVSLSTAASNVFVDLGAGTDALTFGGFANTATVANSETITGGISADTVTLGTALTQGMSVDLRAGNNKLALANTANDGVVRNIATLIGGTGVDSVAFGSAAVAASIDLGAGNDSLAFGNFTNTATVANIETIAGGTGSDTITLASALTTAMSVDLGAGANKLTLGNVANTGSISNVNTLIGGTGNDSITLAAALTTAMSVNLGAGANQLTLANVANTGSLSNIGTLTGGAGNDTITLATALTAAMSVDLGAGANKLSLANAANTGTVSNVNTLVGGTGCDTITLANAVSNGSISLGTGNDTVILANAPNAATIANTKTIIGGISADTITLGTAAANASIDLGGGKDSLAFGNFANTATVANTETLAGGHGNDNITLATGLTTAVSVDLGAGANKLSLANVANTDSVGNVNTLIGGGGNDTVSLGTAVTNGSVDLGAGSDSLTLANGATRLSVANTETVMGGFGGDTIVLSGSTASTVSGGGGMNFIAGNSAADLFVFDQNSVGNMSTILNFSAANQDRIGLDTTASAMLSGDTYDLGGAALLNAIDLKSVTNAATRLATVLNNGGKGAFVYEQDTGALYYSGNGSFAGGGTEIGVITTNGTTPWAYDASKFIQV